MGEEREVYWHLPGLCYFRLLNQIIINLMKDYPEKFRKGYRIGSVYGTFPGAIWNGGRAVSGIVSREDMENVFRMYNSKGIPARLTWTNSLLEERHLQDTYCNLIMRMGDNGLNQVLVNRPVLEEYIRREYPSYKLISSTTKRMVDSTLLKQELEKDYRLVVLDYDLNHNEDVLRGIEAEGHADKVEILVNEICYPNCPKRAEHYRDESRLQLEYTMKSSFQCTNKSTKPSFAECQKRPAFISNDEIQSYIDRGFVNFKIVGRGLPMEFVKESYLYFLVRDETRTFIREKVDRLLSDMLRRSGRKTATFDR